MQTCSRCLKQTSDEIKVCPNCQVNLQEYSTQAITLKRLRENPRLIAIRVSVPADAFTVCQLSGGTYPKNDVPLLPVAGCSERYGCRNFYEPVLDVIYP